MAHVRTNSMDRASSWWYLVQPKTKRNCKLWVLIRYSEVTSCSEHGRCSVTKRAGQYLFPGSSRSQSMTTLRRIINTSLKKQKITWKASGMKAFPDKRLEEIVWDSILKGSRLNLVSFKAVFWVSRNAPPLRDIQKRLRRRLGQTSKRVWFALIKNI